MYHIRIHQVIRMLNCQNIIAVPLESRKKDPGELRGGLRAAL